MNMRERDERLQAEAEAAERQQQPPGANPVVNEYRLVLRALRREPQDSLPADFAAGVARRVLFAEERGSFEDWTLTSLMLAMAAGGLFYLQPLLAGMVGNLHLRLPALPWPLLVAAAIAVVLAWAVDRGASNWHSRR
jgi:hypothetical protein